MLFQMQIPEVFSYVGMKDTKYGMKCFLFLPKNTKWKKELKLNTQAVYEHFIYIFICFFSMLHLLVLLLSILKYEKYFSFNLKRT